MRNIDNILIALLLIVVIRRIFIIWNLKLSSIILGSLHRSLLNLRNSKSSQVEGSILRRKWFIIHSNNPRITEETKRRSQILDVAVKKYIYEHFWRYLHRIEATIINQPFNIVLFRACVETKDANEFLDEFDIMQYYNNDGNCTMLLSE